VSEYIEELRQLIVTLAHKVADDANADACELAGDCAYLVGGDWAFQKALDEQRQLLWPTRPYRAEQLGGGPIETHALRAGMAQTNHQFAMLQITQGLPEDQQEALVTLMECWIEGVFHEIDRLTAVVAALRNEQKAWEPRHSADGQGGDGMAGTRIHDVIEANKFLAQQCARLRDQADMIQKRIESNERWIAEKRARGAKCQEARDAGAAPKRNTEAEPIQKWAEARDGTH
jgi:hypothetical protein